MHGGWNGCHPRECVPDPDFTTPSVRVGYLRRSTPLHFVVIIRWTSNNTGRSPEHYGVVHYGTNPKDLSQTAKSPIRLNPGHSYTVFRVRMDDLKPRTTYYYTVGAMESSGKDDGLRSEVQQFTTN